MRGRPRSFLNFAIFMVKCFLRVSYFYQSWQKKTKIPKIAKKMYENREMVSCKKTCKLIYVRCNRLSKADK